ncbi:proepiregulin isoform X1 [Zonotrichia leucophrys gambelii]|uniref:proepiregulin isoform X1 n=2 Tax=Zonotrichia leucophrys gambelii TaxID=257770 RepID=UPI003140384D
MLGSIHLIYKELAGTSCPDGRCRRGMEGRDGEPTARRDCCAENLRAAGYLLQAVLGTTVIPLCGPGEMENCTTALIQTENSPRVAQVGITRCKPEMKDYCFHGQCVYIVDLDEHYCRCDVGFSGVRCVHSELVRQPLSKEYVALTVIVVLLFLAALSLAAYYVCRRYRSKRRQTNASEYKEVGAL